MAKKLTTRTILVVLFLILIPLAGDTSYRTPGFHNIGRPHAFGPVNWSVDNLLGKGLFRISRCADLSDLSHDERLELVREYLRRGEERGYLEFKLMEIE